MSDLADRITAACKGVREALAGLPARKCGRIQAEQYEALRAAGERRRDALQQEAVGER